MVVEDGMFYEMRETRNGGGDCAAAMISHPMEDEHPGEKG